jgi:hypothetical protein
MLGTLIGLASILVIVATSLAARNARLRVVEEAFRSLGGAPRRTLRGIEGPVRGLPVRYSFHADRNRVSRTLCCADLSIERPAFEMDLRPETRWGVRDVEHGRAIDLVLGDEAFDDSFLVEAAPAEIARALLDQETRTALLTFHPCRLTILHNELRFSKMAALADFAEVRRVLELCIHVRSRLESVPALMHEERLARAREIAPLAGYRGPSPQAISMLTMSSGSAEELAALRRMRVRRTMLRSAQAAAVVALGIVAWLFLASGHG